MQDIISKTIKIYSENIKLVAFFGIFVLLSLILLPLISSYVSAGAGFIRFTSLYLDITPLTAAIFILVGAVSIFLLSLFVSAIISIVKLKETLDHVKFKKLSVTFPRYVKQVFTFLGLLAVLSIAIGVLLSSAQVPTGVIQIIFFAIWLSFVFTPQVIILEDLPIAEAMKDSLLFIKKKPVSLINYLIFGFILILLVTSIETFLAPYFAWEHKIISIILISMVVLPFLQMYATELYIRRYEVARL